MKARLETWLRRIGTTGVLGAGVLIACAGFSVSFLYPLQEQVRAAREASERLRARASYRPASSAGRAEELRRFQNLFPSAAGLTDELERLHSLGRRAGLELARGEYRMERSAAGLWSYRVMLPVAGSYPQLRDFVSAVLKHMPTASIDALRFERKRAADNRLEAQLRLTLYVRPTGESP